MCKCKYKPPIPTRYLAIDEYLFTWEDISSGDSSNIPQELKGYLKFKYNAYWIDNARIDINNSATTRIISITDNMHNITFVCWKIQIYDGIHYTDTYYVTLCINNKEKETFECKQEDNKLKIYTNIIYDRCKYPHVENSDYCIFHDPEYFKRRPEKVREEFYKIVREAVNNNEYIVCIGFNLPEIVLDDHNIFINDISKLIDFSYTKFHGNFRFENINCNEVRFWKTEFNGYTNFNSVFNGKADFRGSKFNTYTTFATSFFNEDVDFSNVTFNEIEFSSTIFNGKVKFERAIFNKKAEFETTEFNHEVSFKDAEFKDAVYFIKRLIHNVP